MDTLQILAISSKAKFPKLIKETFKSSPHRDQPLPAYQVDHLRSLDEVIPETLIQGTQVVLIDFDSLNLSWKELFSFIQDNFTSQPLVLISEEKPSEEIQVLLPEKPLHLIGNSELSSNLFFPFLFSLLVQSTLVQSNREISENLNKRLNELLSLRKASLHLTLNLSLDAVLEAILESAMELVSADDTHIFLYEHGVLSYGAALFDGHQQNKPYMDPRPHGITYQVAREGVMLVVNDIMSDPLFNDRRWEGSIISLPLKIGTTVLGVMNVALKRPHTFTENEIRALEFLGDQASIAIQNAKLYEQSQQEISDRIRAEKAIKHLANHDALTGLPNRRLFNERINLEIAHAQRNKQKIGIMLFDLDHLKKVNDSYGHNVGDLLLQAVAQRLLGLLRKSDTVARMGGDEFLLILPEMHQPQDAIQTAERILTALSTPFHLEGYEVNLTTSIGISFFPDDGDDVNTLVKNADIAMYKAKEKGGNDYHLFTT
jgi:diguanylate cyclase (GGDEF)-like protein